HTRSDRDWSSDVCSSDLAPAYAARARARLSGPDDVVVAEREPGAGARGVGGRKMRIQRERLVVVGDRGFEPLIALTIPVKTPAHDGQRDVTGRNSSHSRR